MVTPASIAAARKRSCNTASACASCALVLMPRTSSSEVSMAMAFKPIFRGDGNRIGEIVLALGVRIADALQNGERVLAGERHQSAIAQSDLAFFRAGVALLADRHKLVAFHDQTAISRPDRRTKSQNRDSGALRQRLTQLAERLGAHQWRVGKHHQNIVRLARDGIFRRQHRMRGASRRSVGRSRRSARYAWPRRRVRRDRGPTTSAMSEDARLRRRSQHMLEQRAAADGVQRLRQARAHPGAFAGREHDRKACSMRHRVFYSRLPELKPHIAGGT